MTRNVLVVGRLEYGRHESNIIVPILDCLSTRGCNIERVGGAMDFFLPKNFAHQAHRWIEKIPADMSKYDLILVTDWWFPALPIYLYQISATSPRPPAIVGLFLGASWLEGDFVESYYCAKELEHYLISVYSRVVVSVEWAIKKSALEHPRDVFYVSRFPMDVYINKVRSNLPYARKVIYNARWDYDKAPERFVAFAEYCKGMDIEFVSFNNPTDKLARVSNESGLIRFTGYPLSENELAEELAGGGYIWNFARQELIGYSVLDMVARGLTPLIANDPRLKGLGFGAQFYFDDYADACRKINDELQMTQQDWMSFVNENKFNAEKIAQAILEVV